MMTKLTPQKNTKVQLFATFRASFASQIAS